MKPPNLTHVESAFWVVEQNLNVGIYDFDFGRYFQCSHPYQLDAPVRAIARLGAAPDYAERYEQMLGWGIELIHTPEEYLRTSVLPQWYPLIESYTPRSHWFDAVPARADVEARFAYPLFMKGERQTSKHRRSSSIIEDARQLDEVLNLWRHDPILHWQRVVCREFMPLRLVAKDHGGALPMSYEFRTFWWHDQCIGAGPYWTTVPYNLTSAEFQVMTSLGREVARRVSVPFLVIDMAQTQAGEWIVIECNDGQDSGYAGVDRRAMWQNLVDIHNAEC